MTSPSAPAGSVSIADGPTSFDLAGPLPTGTTVLEASAGTGKTFTIAALAARFVAEGVAELSELMMVTFGRMATDELRLRVRERLARTELVLAAVRAGSPPTERDAVDALLSTGPPDVLRERHRRIRAALADFDAATIATTHEFCQRMLSGLGVLGDQDPDAVFTDSLNDLVREVATDCYLLRFANAEHAPPFDVDEAVRIATDVAEAGAARLVPTPVPDQRAPVQAEVDRSAAGQRVAFGQDVRRELARRKQRGRLYSYDDMLSRLHGCLTEPGSGQRAASRLRERYRVVLVDEFQDTDPVQWDILRRAFHGHTTLILIGDPKQAIYAFRGADVYSYLDAVGQADVVATLDQNWRSDVGLVRALEQVMGGAALGDPRIVVRAVRAGRQEPRLRLPDGCRAAPLRIRVSEVAAGADRLPRVDELRPVLDRDLAADVARLLGSGAQVWADGSAGTVPGWRPVEPGDVAVLVRSRRRLEPIRQALDDAGVPAVVRGAASVFASAAAEEWYRLLAACEQPRQALIRDVALTAFVGWDLARLVRADDEEITWLSAMVRRWSRALNRQGVAAMVEAVTEETSLAGRLLAQPDGERRLTDLRHVGQALHAAMTADQSGVGALRVWLAERMAEARDSDADEQSRRLETDAAAVQILTIHGSKGLEFPVVYLPQAWDRFLPDDTGQSLRLHADPSPEDRSGAPPGDTLLDIGGALAPGRRDRWRQQRIEEDGEDLRLYYVAMTRARSQLIAWWAPSRNTPGSALQRFLFRSRGGAGESDVSVPAARYEISGSPVGLPQLDQALVSLEQVEDQQGRWEHPTEVPAALERRTFDRVLDLNWRRTSYTALTAAAHGVVAEPGTAPAGGSSGHGADSGVGSGVGSEPETREDDESAALPALEVVSGLPAALDPGPASPMTDLPSGTQFGTVVHAVLERLDPGTADLAAALIALSSEELSRGPAGTLRADLLGPALVPALRTPLGPLAQERALADFAPADRLAELTFELPLAGGERPTTDLRLGALVPLLDQHLAADDPLRDYPRRLAQPLLAEQPLRGYLTGSIDALLRIRGGSPAEVTYLVVDYKTNWLGDPDVSPLPLSHYHPERLAEAMMNAHYPLQALLYSVAVHRFLRWRQRDYDPARHLGGALYLFLRGMAGPETPRAGGVPYGVFSWRPSAALVTGLSDLLDGRG